MTRLDWVNLLYIVGFGAFIVGLRMVRGPRTAVRGNLIAAAGMVVALVATLIDPRIGDWILIVVGVAIGTAIGIPSARSVKMTAMRRWSRCSTAWAAARWRSSRWSSSARGTTSRWRR